MVLHPRKILHKALSPLHFDMSVPTDRDVAAAEHHLAVGEHDPASLRRDHVVQARDDSGELLIAARLPVAETGDRTRAKRAERLAGAYLDRRREQRRADLDHEHKRR